MIQSQWKLFGQTAGILDSDGYEAKPFMQASVKAENKSPEKLRYSCAFISVTNTYI